MTEPVASSSKTKQDEPTPRATAEANQTQDKIDQLLRKSFQDLWKHEYPQLQQEEDWIQSRANPWDCTFADVVSRSLASTGRTFEPVQRVVPSSASPEPEHLGFPRPSSSSDSSDSSDEDSSAAVSRALTIHKKGKAGFGRSSTNAHNSPGCTGWHRQPAFVFFDEAEREAVERFRTTCSASERPPKPDWQVSTAKYDQLPSYDFVMPVLHSRPGECVEFDHHPLIIWEPSGSRWDTLESSELREFWELALVQLESKPEEMYFRSRDPFVDTARFVTAKAFLKEKCQISPDIMDELSAVNEIADDITLVVWLLNRHHVAENVREPWTKFLLKSVKDLSDFFQLPLVEILDAHRATWPESKPRPKVSQRPLGSSFRTVCPIHLDYNCPHHNDEFFDAENGTKATSLTRDKILPAEVREPSTKCCGSNMCWFRLENTEETLLAMHRMRTMNFEQLTSAWSQEDRSFLREIFPKFYKATPCQMALFLPSHDCFEFYFILQRALEEGYDNPALGHNPYTNTEQKMPHGSPPKSHSRTIESKDVETSNLSKTLHVLAHRPADAKAAQATKDAEYLRREEEMEEKPWKQLKPNENWGYSPCSHIGQTCEEAAVTDDCLCHGNRTWCDKFCHCPLDCPRRFPGCYNECHSKGGKCRTESCPCYQLCRECDPEICNGRVKQPTICGNMQLQTRRHKKNFVGISPVEGFGLFAGLDYRDGELVEEYKGELISHDEANARDVVFKRRRKTYFYELDRRKGIDSEFFGNRARYINAPPSGEGNQRRQKANCQARVFYVLGEHRIGVFCDLKRIQAGDELLMDYGPLYEFYEPA